MHWNFVHASLTMIIKFHIVHAEAVVRHLRIGYAIFHFSWKTVHLGVCFPASYSVCREVEDVVRENVRLLLIPAITLLRDYIHVRYKTTMPVLNFYGSKQRRPTTTL